MKSGILTLFEQYQQEISSIINIGCDNDNAFCLNHFTEQLCQISNAMAVITHISWENNNTVKEKICFAASDTQFSSMQERENLLTFLKANYKQEHQISEISEELIKRESEYNITEVIELDLFKKQKNSGHIFVFFSTKQANHTA